MKKFLVKLLVGVLAVGLLLTSLIACAETGWKKTSLTSWGEGDVVGGFIGEKGDYVYYINGNGSYTSKNSFGTPVKGSLMVFDKANLTVTEIAVPKLFTAADYNAGLYIFGDYVYYGTPSTEKNSSGAVANTEMTFMRTKLDGTGTETFLTIDSRSSEYRIAEADGVVYIVYFDSNNSALKVYNTTTRSSSIIAKTDEKTEGRETLKDHMFAKNGDDVTLYYTVTVYREDYLEEKGSRDTQNYNAVYSYTVGQVAEDGAELVGTKILNGESEFATYGLSLTYANKLFLTKTVNEKASDYVYTVDDGIEKLKNKKSASVNNLFVNNDVYVVSDGKIMKGSFTESENLMQTVALASASTLLGIDTVSVEVEENQFVDYSYIYYINSDGRICRVELNNENANEQIVSEDTVMTSWYRPQFIEINNQTYLFYCDTSSYGAGYIKHINLNTCELVSEDTDDDDEDDKFYLTGQEFMAKITDSDMAYLVTNEINDIVSKLENGVLPYEEKEIGGETVLTVKAVEEARASYQALSPNAKEHVEKAVLTKLEGYEKAIEMANLYNKLVGIEKDNLTEQQLQDYEEAYLEIKSQILSFRAQSNYSTISSYIDNNWLWSFDKAVELFDSEE